MRRMNTRYWNMKRGTKVRPRIRCWIMRRRTGKV